MSTPVSDERLVRQAVSGDLTAFEELVERHGAVVGRVVRRIVGPDDAEDVTQEVFLRAFHRLGQFRADAPFRSWLLRIAHNTALNALQRRVDVPRETAEVSGELERRAPAGPVTPADALERRERAARLEDKLALLRREHRVVLVLRDIEGLSYDELAAITDAPLGSVKGRLHRARRELVELLRRNTYDWELPE